VRVMRREHAGLAHRDVDAEFDVQVGAKGERLVLGQAQPGPAGHSRVHVEVVGATAEPTDQRRKISRVALEHGVEVDDFKVDATDVTGGCTADTSPGVHGAKRIRPGGVRGMTNTEVVTHAVVAACAVRVDPDPVDF
jgi:hypothetical protein